MPVIPQSVIHAPERVRPVACLSGPRPHWSDAQRAAWQGATSAYYTMYLVETVSEVAHASAYATWQIIEREIAPLFAEEE